MAEFLNNFINGIGLVHLQLDQVIMILIALGLMYLGIVKKFEPLLLVPIGFGIVIANLPIANLSSHDEGYLLYHLYLGVKYVIYPPLIYMCIGALTDFGPLIARPSTFMIGAVGGQLGIFTSFGLAMLAGKVIPGMTPFTIYEAASIGIIGAPTAPPRFSSRPSSLLIYCL